VKNGVVDVGHPRASAGDAGANLGRLIASEP
jgi:hypothetical protein